MSIIQLETGEDSMTVAWAPVPPGAPREVEIRVNEQTTPTKVSIANGLVRKKNLKPGDVLEVRVDWPNGSWGQWHQFHFDGVATTLPPPKVRFELDPEDPNSAAALVEFPPIAGCARYELALSPLDGPTSEWTSVTNSLTSTTVRKKNLKAKTAYSFRYRGMQPPDEWTAWSAASIPQLAPESNPILSRVLSKKLLRTDGSLVDPSSLSGKVVALYFSAHWCPPCRQFTPRLVEFYKMMKSLGKPFEVVFISADHDAMSFQEYFNEMGWLAIPYDDHRREEIQGEHAVRGIPSLKILSSKTGKVVEADAIRFPLTPATFDAWQSKM